MGVWFDTLASVTAVSLLGLVGLLALRWDRERISFLSLHLIGFAAGALLGDAALHLIPDAYEHLGTGLLPSLLFLGGLLGFHLVERVLRLEHVHTHTHAQVQPFVFVSLVGDAAHNFVDGVVIAATFSVDVRVGITTTLAIVLHEIPHELGQYAILVHGGVSVPRAVLWNLCTALAAFAGAIVTLIAGQHFSDLAVYMLPWTAGGFVYIACSDLIPELLEEGRARHAAAQFMLILLGAGLMLALRLLG